MPKKGKKHTTKNVQIYTYKVGGGGGGGGRRGRIEWVSFIAINQIEDTMFHGLKSLHS